MNKTKITEGVGYITGDMECWCINPFPFEIMKAKMRNALLIKNYYEVIRLDKSRVYPSTFVPEGDFTGKRARYKITFEVEELE